MVHCYLFEASSIQEFVFASNRLKEIVGASELVEALCGDLLDSTLRAADATGRVTFSRKAGGAFFAFFDDSDLRDRFAALWPLVVQQHAPGLTFMSARGSGTTEAAAFAAAKRPFLAAHNIPPSQLPIAGPYVLRNQRTGMPAVAVRGYDHEEVDAATSRKLDLSSGHSLAMRCCSKKEFRWPLQLSAEGNNHTDDLMPYRGEKQWLALIHADGNGLGQLLIQLGNSWQNMADFRERFSALSTAVSRATEKAVQEAVARVLEPAAVDRLLPARPIILGGDDLTMLVRADLALDFTEAYLLAFEKWTAAEFSALHANAGYQALPECLTACAGIAYIEAHRPFYLTVGLANSLCRIAKKVSKRQTPALSSVSFHRVTTSFIPDAGDVFADEMVSHLGEDEFRHTMAVYAVRDGVPGIPSIALLKQFRDFISREEVGAGRFRRLLDEMSKEKRAEAEKLYRRWKEISDEKLVAEFEAALTSLTGSVCLQSLPYASIERSYQTPLGDAIALSAVGQEN